MTPLLGILVATSTSAGPASRLDVIRARGTLIVAVKNEGAKAAAAHKDPAHFQKRNFELEIARHIAKRIVGDETKLVLKILPRRDRLAAVARGDVDLVISMIRVDAESKQVIDFSAPYYEGGFALLLPVGSSVSALEALKGRRVGLPRQSANDPLARVEAFFDEQNLEVALVRFETFKQAADALRAGRIDALLSYNPNVEAYLRASPGAANKFRKLLTQDAHAVGVKKGEPALLRAVDEVILGLRNSGELDRIAAKWGLATPKAAD